MNAPPAKERAPVGAPTKPEQRIKQDLNHGNSEAQSQRLMPAVIGLIPVHVTLELIEAYSGATAVAHSYMERDGRRIIRVALCKNQLLVCKALARADTLCIRFLVALSLVEWCLFWASATDGRGITRALRHMAGYGPQERSWGSGFASRLAVSLPMRSVDAIPIFGATPVDGRHLLFEFQAELRSPSDIRNWRSSNGAIEEVAPLPPKRRKEPARPPETAPASPQQQFYEAFHAVAREALDASTFSTLEELIQTKKGG
jgi:hypothetical protein